MKVLLVDDEVDFVEVLAERLEARGLKVETAGDGQAALVKAAERTFDAILLDMAMPKLDGIQTLRGLLKINSDLQVILLTGHATVEKGIEAMKLGAMDLIEKPADLSTIVDRIKSAKAEKIILVEKKSEKRIRDLLTRKGW